MPFSKQNHIQHEICMFVSTGRVGSCTRILSNDLAGVTTPCMDTYYGRVWWNVSQRHLLKLYCNIGKNNYLAVFLSGKSRLEKIFLENSKFIYIFKKSCSLAPNIEFFRLCFSGARALGLQTKQFDKTNILRGYCPISNIHASSKVSTTVNCSNTWLKLRGASFFYVKFSIKFKTR